MSRWKAFGIHFSMSATVLLALLAVIMWVWFPGILFSVDGGWTGLRIVIGVDLVLGPLLTLVVFKAGKPGLKFDLTVIGVFQISCMAAGMWIVYSERPLALVLAHDTVYSIAAQEFSEYGKDPAVLEQFPGRYPKLIFTEMPENDVAADIAAIRSQFIGDPLYVQTDLYRSMPTQNLEQVFRRSEQVVGTITDELKARLPENCLLSNFISAVTSGYICYDPEQNQYIEFYSNQYTRVAESVPASPEVEA